MELITVVSSLCSLSDNACIVAKMELLLNTSLHQVGCPLKYEAV